MRRLGQDVGPDYELDPGEPADTMISRVEDAARMTAAIEKLSAEQSRVIRMSFIEERPHTEIAEVLGDSARHRKIQDQIGDEPSARAVGRRDMTITHHAPEDLLADFATGALDQAEHLVVAVHVSQCARCRRLVAAIEQLAGAAIEDAAPALMSVDLFDNVMARIDALPKAAIQRERLPASRSGQRRSARNSEALSFRQNQARCAGS